MEDFPRFNFDWNEFLNWFDIGAFIKHGLFVMVSAFGLKTYIFILRYFDLIQKQNM